MMVYVGSSIHMCIQLGLPSLPSWRVTSSPQPNLASIRQQKYSTIALTKKGQVRSVQTRGHCIKYHQVNLHITFSCHFTGYHRCHGYSIESELMGSNEWTLSQMTRTQSFHFHLLLLAMLDTIPCFLVKYDKSMSKNTFSSIRIAFDVLKLDTTRATSLVDLPGMPYLMAFLYISGGYRLNMKDTALVIH